MQPGVPVGGAQDARPRRLDSWKEIAAFFGRDARTVRRWEQKESLPVHRHVHGSRGSVYAFQEELDLWLQHRTVGATGVPGPPAPRRGRRLLWAVLAVPAVLALVIWIWTAKTTKPAPESLVGNAGKLPADTTSALTSAGPDVRERFLLARHQLQRRAGWQEALAHLKYVTQRAPAFAEAYALLGEANVRRAVRDPAGNAAAWAEAETSVRRALALDVNLPIAHAVLSRILLIRDWDFAGAAGESVQAISLGPEDSDARNAYAVYLRAVGRPAEAVVERERAQRADPLNPQALVHLGDEYCFARRYEDARRAYERALKIDRDYRPAVSSLAEVNARLNRYADAAAWQFRWLAASAPDDARAFEEVRRHQGAQAAMEWFDRLNIERLELTPDAHSWDLGYLHARLQNKDAALGFLQRATDRRDPGMLQARVDPDLDSLREDPRFRKLLQQLGEGGR